jgi:CBS domain-containing protein
MYVNELMTTQLKTCRPDSSLDDIARMMWDGDCGAIPVVTQDNKPVGIITDRDVAMAAMLQHRPLWDIRAAEVIGGQSLCCCNQQESVESCLQKMEQQKVRRVLITDETDALCGILSMGDALAFTKGKGTAKAREKVDVGNVIGMLKKVSAHHESGVLPPMHSRQSTARQPSPAM